MSLRYTGGATMEGLALRDVEHHWKDKIEVRLDNRQVFFLFFGSALVACMLFVLGVLVGKRLETRGRAEAPTVEDPLAVLDRFRTASPTVALDDALTFPRNLIVPTGGGAAARVKSGAAQGPRDDRAPARETRTAASALLTAAASTAAAPVAPERAPRPATAAPGPSALVPGPGITPVPVAPAPSGSGSAESGPAPAAPDRARGHFLLQLGSFQDRADAEALARRFVAQDAYVVASELPGKGTSYHVRLGTFASRQEASFAKAAFERTHNVIAYVAGTGPAR